MAVFKVVKYDRSALPPTHPLHFHQHLDPPPRRHLHLMIKILDRRIFNLMRLAQRSSPFLRLLRSKN